jgi:transcriptional regulator GlxA family with amidase domain
MRNINAIREITHPTPQSAIGLSYSAAVKIKVALDEYLRRLLRSQAHHGSADITEPGRVPATGLVRRAERFMIENAEKPITVSDVAAELGVSVRTLQTRFHAWRDTTPNTVLRNIRLQFVRDELRRSRGETKVTATAMRYGFSHLGRFSSYYRLAFGETPNETLRRSRLSRRERLPRGRHIFAQNG